MPGPDDNGKDTVKKMNAIISIIPVVNTLEYL